MGKIVNNLVLDAALNYIKNNATKMSALTVEPATYAEATSGATCLSIKTGISFTGPGDGDVSGRKIAIGQEAAVDVIATGEASHVALCDAANVLYVTTCTPQILYAGNTVTFPPWDIEIEDPE